MRVGISGAFWPATIAGSGQHLRGLLPALLGADATVSFRLYLPCYSLTRNASIAAPTETVLVRTPFDRLNRNLAKVWFEQVALPEAALRDGIELLHVPYLGSPWKHKMPVVVTIHDLIPVLLPAYRASPSVRLYTWLACQAARRAEQVIAVSESAASDVQRLLGIPAERTHVIYNALPVGYAPPAESELAAAAQRLRLPHRYLIYLGGFDRRKQVPELLQAFKAVSARFPGVQLVIAGRLPRRDCVFTPDPQRIARELGLEANVQFLGEVTEADKPAVYTGAMALIFPSIYEGFGLPVLEALACGTPAVVCSGSSLEEVAGAGALYIPPYDGPALERAIIAISTNNELRERLGSAGRAHVKRFSWETSARQTLAVYRTAMASGIGALR